MNIDHIHIRNFRKLKDCRIDIDKDQTIFVGANNSGKTSAMSALLWFLKYNDRFTTREFTLTNWKRINEIGDKWTEKDDPGANWLSRDKWEDLVPTLDLWLNVEEDEAYLVYQLIPSLDWDKKMVGIRLRFEPKDINVLYSDYRDACSKVKVLKASEKHQEAKDVELYPKDLWDFLNRAGKLRKYFEVKRYVLDPAKDGGAIPQATPSMPLDSDPLGNLIRIDSIEAYREFSDPEGKNESEIDTLSRQLQDYYHKNFEEEAEVLVDDLPLMGDMKNAQKSFDSKLGKSFKQPIDELSNINYPGFQNPKIEIKSKLDIAGSISHDSAVQFALQGNDALTLPEKYNGLGMRNLISMYLKLIQFREEWTHPKEDSEKGKTTVIASIHLVLIEEPEAHLHAQAQQVFIRKALEALRDSSRNDVLNEHAELTTQLVVTTHSNHIVNEVDMNSLRYFKRIIDPKDNIPVSEVVNMSSTFGQDEDETRKFVTRYIKLTHCDIFFADAAILVEGAAEKILMPHFLKQIEMHSYYLAVIEINGSHAYRFKTLVEKLGLPTLVVTDIDAQEEQENGGKKSWHAALPKRDANQTTNNDTIRTWLEISDIDELLDLSFDDKLKNTVRIAYQTPLEVLWEEGKPAKNILPYTFEDSLIFTNINLLRGEEKLSKMGAVTTAYNLLQKNAAIEDFHQALFDHLEKSGFTKAEFATTLLLSDKFNDLVAPDYIKEGLEWLKSELEPQ